MVATSATIIPAPSSHQHPTLSIPVQTQQKTSEPPTDSMSLIVQLGTTSVGYTPTFNTSVGTVAVTNHAATNAASRLVNTNQIQVAKHRLPMTINRQPQQHTLPVRNIAALARPIQQTSIMANTTSTAQVQNQNTTPVVAGRVLASPVKDTSLDDDLLEGVVEKRPKYHKHLPLNYQYVLQDHNYGAPPPPTPPAVSPSKSPINGMPASNGVPVSHSHTSHSHSHSHSHPHSHGHIHGRSPTQPQPNSYSASVLYNSSRQVTNVSAVPNDIESDVSSDGEREVEPEGEETETAPEGEGDNEDDSITRCICDFQHDDGYMICCDRCSVWQHVDCMGIDRGNIPDEYLCEKCQPRRVEKQRAIALQIRKRREIFDTSDSSSETSSSSDNPAAVKPAIRKRAVVGRRRSEPVRKPSISSAAKPRRESAKEMSSQPSARQNNRQTNRKRHVEKRPPVRRKNASMTNNSLHNTNINSNAEKKNSTPSASSLTSTTTSSSSSSSLSSSSTSSLTSEKVNHHHEKNLTSPNSSSSSGDSVQQLRQWIDSYEEAVTNHYSPELRARIGNIKVNGVHSDLRLPSNLLATPKCRISLLPSGIKILMTCANVAINQPLIELRGKYMLAGNNGPGLTNRPPRPAAPPPPGPYIFHYKLPRDNTEVCVDCRTYGNDARFVRRSCQPNSEIRHCIEKGTLHLYLVTTSPIDKNSEVTIAHTPTCGIPCVCGEKDCSSKKEKELLITRDSPPPRNQEKKNGVLKATNNVAPSSNSQSTVEKRRRGRRRTASENQSAENNSRTSEKGSVSHKQNSSSTNSTSTEKTPAPPSPPSPPSLPPLTRSASSGSRPGKINQSITAVNNTNSTRNSSPSVNNKKDESAKTNSNSNSSNNINNNNNITNNNNKTNNNNNNNNDHNKNSNNHDEDVNNKKNSSNNSNSVTESERKVAADKKKMTREERKLEAIMKAFERMEKDQAKRETLHRQAQQRKDSTDAEKEKQLAIVETKTTQSKEKERDEQSASNNNTNNNKNNSIRKRRRKGRGRTHPMHQAVSRARARRVTRRSRNSLTNSRTLANNQDDSDSGHSTDNELDEDSPSPRKQSSTSSNVNQAADLLMSLSSQNSYVDEKDQDEDGTVYRRSSYQNDSSKDQVDDHTEEDDDEDGMQRLNTSTSSSDTPPTPLSKTCLVVAAAVGSLAPGFKFPKTKKGLLNTWFKAPEPGSPPSAPAPDDSPTRPGPGKKRWLRQAISEECESPNRPEMSVSPTDYVAPLKKRRLARESISSEQSFTPPATPVEPVNQLNYEDEEEDNFGPVAEKTNEYDENDGGCSSAESDADSPAGPRTPVGPEPKSEPDSIKEEKNLEVDENMRLLHEEDETAVSVQVKEEIKVKIEKDDCDKKEKKSNAPARKKVLSISEYRQRKMQGGRESHDGEIDGDEGDGPEGGTGHTNMATSSPRSHSSESSSMSSSDEEENHANAMAKSLLMDANSSLPKPGAGTSRFSCAPTLVERQRENLTERLRREFGLFLSDDEENMAARRQSLNNEIQLQPVQLSTVITTPSPSVPTVAEKKDTSLSSGGTEKEKRKKPPPPPPPPLPVPGPVPTGYSMYPGYMTGVRGPAVYPQPYGIPPPLPPPTLEPVNVGSAAPYYGPPSAYYGQLPHSH